MAVKDQFPNGIQWCRQLSVEQQAADYSLQAQSVLSEAAMQSALKEVSSWPEYTPTPLHRLSKLEQHLGCDSIHYKDESQRFGLQSFKALGGAYAVLKLVAGQYQQQQNKSVALQDIRQGQIKDFAATITSVGREQAMQALGAEVIRIDGDYDESVKQCAADSERNGWYMVSDTSYDGYTSIPADVMAGYTVMASEIIEQLSEPPTHVFLQAGVGGLAAAVSARLWMEYGSKRPHITLVESDYSACVMQSFTDSAAATVEIVKETVMAGLSCGEMSLLTDRSRGVCCSRGHCFNGCGIC